MSGRKVITLLSLCTLLSLLPLGAATAQGPPPPLERLPLGEHDRRNPEARPWGPPETAGRAETADPTSLSWHIELMDDPKTFSDMGQRCLDLDASDYPHIAYGEDHLYYAWYDGSAWHLETADASWGVGRYTSLALDAAGRPHISYYDDWPHYALKYAHFDGTAWFTETVDSADVGRYSSLVLDTNNHPYISYYDFGWDRGDLKCAHFDGTSWMSETVDSTGNVGE